MGAASDGKARRREATPVAGLLGLLSSPVTENLNKHLSKLSKRGPHRVLVGDLAYAGIEGKVYTPAEGNNIPGIAFGHDWRNRIANYHGTLRHLASWGIAVAAPDTELGLAPSHRGFAADLETCLQILAGVRLGHGHVVVGPGKLGVAGHGMGAACAIIAATDSEKIRAVGALYPATTSPSAEEAAKAVTVPGLIIGSEESDLINSGNPERVANNWGGEVTYRSMTNGNQRGFTENTAWKLLIGSGEPQPGARELARGLLTGFLLHQLDGEKKYSGFSDPEATASKTIAYSGDDLAELAKNSGSGVRIST